MSSFICVITLVLLALAIRVQSSYYVYTYGGDEVESCCLVRVGEQFCLGKPLTRSLVQVNKECQRLGANEKNKNYLKQIARRLDVERSDKVGDKILVQLSNPLDKDLLANDLLCLSTTTNNIDLEKCYVRLAVKKQKKSKGKGQNDTTDGDESDDENKIPEVQVTEPVRVRSGHGLTVRQTYQLNLTDFRATTRQQRECWAWYRKHTKNLLNHPTKLKKSCVPFNRQQEKCLQALFYKNADANQRDSFPTGSKLYCETAQEQTKLLGYHRRSEICFISHYQIHLEHQFTDFLSLSDRKKNRDVLQFISNNTKLANEFEADCRDKNTLDEIRESIKEEKEAEEEKEKEQEQAKSLAEDEELAGEE